MTIHFAPKGEADFAAIVGYLAERNPTAAANLGDRIFTVIQPGRGAHRETSGRTGW